MGIEIPDELQWVAKYILGAGDWPDGDETAMRRVADGWTAMANTLNTVDDDAVKVLNVVLSAISEGETHISIATIRDKLLAGDQATFAAVRKWCESQAELLEDGANDIEHTKMVIIGTMIVTAVEILATAWTGVGLIASAAARIAGQIAVRLAIRQLIARMLTRAAAKAAGRMALWGAVFEAAEEGGVDLAARLIQVSNGDRSTGKFGLADLGLATLGGAVGGAVGGVLGGGTGALGDAASSVVGKAATKVVGGTVTELGADVSAQVAAAGVGAAFMDREFQLDIGVDTFTSAGAGGVQSAIDSSGSGGNAAAPTVPELGTETPGATAPAGTGAPAEGGDQSPAGNGSPAGGPPTTPAGTDIGSPTDTGAPTTPAATDPGSPTAPASTGEPSADGAATSPQNSAPDTPAQGVPTTADPNSNGANGTPPTSDSAPPNTDGGAGATPDGGDTPAPSSAPNGAESQPVDSSPSTPNTSGPTATPPAVESAPSTPNTDGPTATPVQGDTPISSTNGTDTSPPPSSPSTNPATDSPSNPPTSASVSSPSSLSNAGSPLDLPSQEPPPQSSTQSDNTPANTPTGQQNPTPATPIATEQPGITSPNPQAATPPPTTPTAPESTPQQPATSIPAATNPTPSTASPPPTPTNNPDASRPTPTDTSAAAASTTTSPPAQSGSPSLATAPTSMASPPTTPTSAPTPPIAHVPTSTATSPRANTPPSNSPASAGSAPTAAQLPIIQPPSSPPTNRSHASTTTTPPQSRPNTTAPLSPTSPPGSPAGPTDYAETGGARRPRNIYDETAQVAWAEGAYDHFRGTDNDLNRMVAELAEVERPDGTSGFTRAEIEQVKNHLFREEHPLTVRDDDGKPIGFENRRYDADADIAEAWIRMSLGRPTPADIVLLEHELAEARYYAEHPGSSYQDAHRFANESFNWQALRPPRTGENIDEWRSALGDLSGLSEEVGDGNGSDLPVRGGGGSTRPGTDDQQGGLLSDSSGRPGGHARGENSGPRDEQTPPGRNLDTGGRHPSVGGSSPQTGGRNDDDDRSAEATRQSPSTAQHNPSETAAQPTPQLPAAAAASASIPTGTQSQPLSPSTESTPLPPNQHGSVTAQPAPSVSSPTPQQVDNANQARAARDNLRSQRPDGGVVPVTAPGGGRRFTVARFTAAFNAPVSMLRVGVGISGAGHLDPALVHALIERAQLAVDLHFNHGSRLPSGDWMMVDLVPVSAPGAADMTIDLDPANPHSTPTDADLDNLLAMLRDQLGLDPATESELSPSDVQRISDEIDQATPASVPTSPRTTPGSVTTDSSLDLPTQPASPAIRPDATGGLPNAAVSPPSSPRTESPNQPRPQHVPAGPDVRGQIPPRSPDHRAPESAPPPTNPPGSNSPTGAANRPFGNHPDFTPETPQWHQSWASPNPEQRSTGSIRRMVRKLFGVRPSRNIPSTPPRTPPNQRPQAAAPRRPSPTSIPQRSTAPQYFTDLPYSVGPPFTTQEMNSTYRGEHEVGNSVWPPGRWVAYLDEIVRQQTRLYIVDGLIYDATGTLFDTSAGVTAHGGAGRAIFVMDEHGNLYASNYHEPGLFHHSSFLAGGNVAAAGELVVIDGELQMVTDSSGHYRPSRGHTMQAIDLLRNMGIPIDPGQVRFEAPPQ
ncbi:hypothetical protein ACFWUP_24225 [Nocardia sp. NPDC058658]|uniref:WXG100-like domain-containing protein n=1 Tax=Nocardia sp. NPDC058658 TaxID=3346580 RepID=UPI00365F5EEC